MAVFARWGVRVNKEALDELLVGTLHILRRELEIRRSRAQAVTTLKLRVGLTKKDGLQLFGSLHGLGHR